MNTDEERRESDEGACLMAAGGEGAGAPSPETWTINQKSLGDLFLPAERDEATAVDYLWARFMKAKPGSAEETALNVAVSVVRQQWRETVRVIRDRGGLLLIGGRG